MLEGKQAISTSMNRKCKLETLTPSLTIQERAHLSTRVARKSKLATIIQEAKAKLKTAKAQ